LVWNPCERDDDRQDFAPDDPKFYYYSLHCAVKGIAKIIITVILKNNKNSAEAVFMTVCFLHGSKQDGKG
jgi:hypothetical protein